MQILFSTAESSSLCDPHGISTGKTSLFPAGDLGTIPCEFAVLRLFCKIHKVSKIRVSARFRKYKFRKVSQIGFSFRKVSQVSQGFRNGQFADAPPALVPGTVTAVSSCPNDVGRCCQLDREIPSSQDSGPAGAVSTVGPGCSGTGI